MFAVGVASNPGDQPANEWPTEAPRKRGLVKGATLPQNAALPRRSSQNSACGVDGKKTNVRHWRASVACGDKAAMSLEGELCLETLLGAVRRGGAPAYPQLLHSVDERGALHAQAFRSATSAADDPVARIESSQYMVFFQFTETG